MCLHCGLPVDRGRLSDFCCPGCEAVYGLLRSEHLEGYYALRGDRGVPASTTSDRRDTKWLEPIEDRVRAAPDSERIILDVQGLHCVGCVWLIDELFARAGGTRIVINPSLGRADLVVPHDFDLRGFVRNVERFGYLFGPPVKREPTASRDLTWRLGTCVAIAMNSMIFAIAIYAGLSSGPLYELFTTLNLLLGTCAVAVGGTVFFRSAWLGIRQRVLHLDLPIATGIALAFGSSVWMFAVHRPRGAYFDTLDVFITLMLLGRWLQERAVERNRAWLLASDGSEGLLARRLEGDRVQLVGCNAVHEGDRLLIAPGDLLPVDGVLERGGTAFSLDWIVGESTPRSYRLGDTVPAGAFSAGSEAAIVRSATDFAASPLRALLATPTESRDPQSARATPWFQRFAKMYVAGVLLLGAAGFVGWWLATHDFVRALSVTTSLLIVTCPCAFGIAVPLAYEMAQAGLRRAGLFVRRASFLDRARTVRQVVLDKTGTLTTGRLRVDRPERLAVLCREERDALYNLVARSGHPKSTAIRDALGRDANFQEDAVVIEEPGLGLEMRRDGKRWRLGSPSWVVSGPVDPECDVAFGVDGDLVLALRTLECLRQEANRDVAALRRAGYDVWLLSGDAAHRVSEAAEAAGIAEDHAVGEQTPASKAAFLDAHDGDDTLFVGDGVNDALALDRACVAGTPAVDRPYVPARADFFFVTPGLDPIWLALRTAGALAQIVRTDLAIAFAYNGVTVALALVGRMSPLLCAVLMPLSSLSTIGFTVVSLSRRSRLWRS